MLTGLLFIITCKVNAQAPAWLWAKEAYSGVDEYATDIATDTTTGELVVTGIFNSDLSAFYGSRFAGAIGGGFVAKYDASGNVIWAFPVGNNQDDACNGVTVDSVGNIYITGYVQNVADVRGTLTGPPIYITSSGGKDIFVAKYNSAGQLLWSKTAGGNNDDEGYAVTCNGTAVFVSGYFNGLSNFGSLVITGAGVNDNAFVAAFDPSSGTGQWVAGSGALTTYAYARDIVADDNGVYLIGDFTGTALNVTDASGTLQNAIIGLSLLTTDVFLISYSNAGAYNWARTIQSAGNDMGYGICQLNNCVYVSGAVSSNANFPSYASNPVAPGASGTDMFIAQLKKSNGNTLWARSEPGTGNQATMSVCANKQNSIFAAGYFNNSVTFAGSTSISSTGAEDVFLARYDTSGNFIWVNKGGDAKTDKALGVSTDKQNGAHIGGIYTKDAVFPPFTLNRADGSSLNILVATIGCVPISNNTVTAAQTICAGQVPSAINGSVPSGGNAPYSYLWQQSSNNITWSSATGVNSSQNYSPPALSTNTYFRRAVTSLTGCLSQDTSASILITVNQLPGIANAGNDTATCNSSVTLNANSPVAGSGAWSIVAGIGSIATVNSPSSTVTGLGVGINTFVWTLSNGVCPISSDTIAIKGLPGPDPASAGPDQSICLSTYTLNANTPVLGNGQWAVLTGSSTLSLGTSPNSAALGLSTGPNTFVWTISNTCGANSDTVVINVDANPSISFAGADQTICSSTSAMLGSSPSVGIGKWNVLNGGSTVTNPFQNNSPVAGLTVGINSFEWVISNGVCPLSRDTVIIQVDAFPSTANAGSDQTICSDSSLLSATTPTIGTGAWSVYSGPGIVVNPNANVTTVHNLGIGQNALIWTVINGVCPSSYDSVLIHVDAVPTISNAGSPQTLCADSAVLSGNIPSVGVGTWTVVSGGGSIDTPTQYNSGVENLSVGQNVFSWTITNGVCPASTSTVIITVDAMPSLANAGSDQSICSSTYTLTATAPLVGNGVWSVLSGNAIVQSPTNNISATNSLSIGLNTFVWSVTNGTCPASHDTVHISVDANPSPANAGNAQTICSPTIALGATAPVIGTGVWVTAGGSASVVSPSQSNSTVINLSTGINVFVWTVSNGTCPSVRDTVYITVDAFPTVANAGSDQSICNTSASLSANLPVTGNGVWSSPGSGIISNVSQSSTGVSALNTGSNVFIWTITNGVCPSSVDSVTINVSAPPSSAVAGNDLNICVSTSNVNLAAIPPVTGIGLWTSVSGGSFANAGQATTAVSGLLVGQNTFIWTVSSGVCPPVSDSMNVFVFPYPSVANAGQDQVLSTNSTSLSGNVPVNGNGTWVLVSGGGIMNNTSDPYCAVTGLELGDNIFGWTLSNGVCPDSYDEVTIHVNDLFVPNGFSPNGDNVNDNFEIPGLLQYSNVKLEVYNRWGNLVYDNTNYKNDWNGLNTNGEELSDDTYYYTLIISSKKTYKGFVVLKRK